MKINFVQSLVFILVAGRLPLVMAQSPGTFIATRSMTTVRALHTATLLLDGRVLITGGFNGNGERFAGNELISAELYDPSTGTFTPTGSMTTGRISPSATLLPDGRVLIAGGTRGNPNSTELYDPSSGTFTATGYTASGGGILLSNGKVLMMGDSNAELYDPATGSFTATGAYAARLLWTVTNLLADGRVLIIGCATTDSDGYCLDPGSVAQLYDPAAGTFSLGVIGYTEGTSRAELLFSTSTLLTNGKVLSAGGAGELGSYPNAALYDASTGNFTATGNMTTARASHRDTLLPDGKVLITGGASIRSAELYDPPTGTFISVGNMIGQRYDHTATLLKDGRVLITGGFQFNPNTNPTTLSSAELYTPPVLAPPPVLLSLSGDGRGQGAILHGDTHQVVSSSNPAVAGEALEIYGNGLIDGSVIPPQVVIGGRIAEVLFFGKAPGFTGLSQVNVRVPSGVAPGDAVAVRLIYLSRPSNEVTIGVR